MTDYKFEGWLGHDENAAKGNMVWGEFEPKPWEETDVDIKVTHCGICGSDLHTLRSGWGPTPYPCCVGHEIVGIAVRVGSKAEGNIKVGDRVGVGAQSDSCRGRLGKKCEECESGLEQYCHNLISTYAAYYLNGGKSYGGYALYNRAPSHFVIKIPDALPSAAAAPMLCAGITMYSPLKYYGGGPEKSVGIVGMGGLGHFGVLWAKALGFERVVAISRSANKAPDALKLGADTYIATADDPSWLEKHAGSLDLVISTISSSISLGDYLSLLHTNGTFVQIGNPDGAMVKVPVPAIIMRRRKVGGSVIGSPAEIREMLSLAAEKNIRPMIEERPMKEANKAIVDMEAGKARYRYVLVNEEHL